jgi:hypothetical protein
VTAGGGGRLWRLITRNELAGTTSPGADEDDVPSVPHSLVQGDADTFGRTDGA